VSVWAGDHLKKTVPRPPGHEAAIRLVAAACSFRWQRLIGLEATSRDAEKLYHFLESRGYQLCLLHPRQTHQFANQRGLRAKTDKLDANTIAREVRETERRGAALCRRTCLRQARELARLQTQLTEDLTRSRNEIHALLQVLFPEFNQGSTRSRRVMPRQP
jgi:transposase